MRPNVPMQEQSHLFIPWSNKIRRSIKIKDHCHTVPIGTLGHVDGRQLLSRIRYEVQPWFNHCRQCDCRHRQNDNAPHRHGASAVRTTRLGCICPTAGRSTTSAGQHPKTRPPKREIQTRQPIRRKPSERTLQQMQSCRPPARVHKERMSADCFRIIACLDEQASSELILARPLSPFA